MLRPLAGYETRPVGCGGETFAIEGAELELHRESAFAERWVFFEGEAFLELHLSFGKRLTIPHRVSQAGLWEMWQRWGYECDESYATARGGAA